MGTRVVGRAVLAFDHVRVPASHRIGEEGRAFYQIMQGFDYNRVGIALACLGVAQVSIEETMAYTKERRAFGRALASFEGVSFAIAEAATHLEALALLPRVLSTATTVTPTSCRSSSGCATSSGWRSATARPR